MVLVIVIFVIQLWFQTQGIFRRGKKDFWFRLSTEVKSPTFFFDSQEKHGHVPLKLRNYFKL